MTRPTHGPTGVVWDIKQYAIHDGPGIRTTVFLKGCPLRCLWCCNPESQDPRPEWLHVPARCLGCGACAAACPQGAIRRDAEGGPVRDPALCTLCGACAAACPAEALAIAGREMTVDGVLDAAARDAVFFFRSEGGLTLSGGEPLAQPRFSAAVLRRAREEYGLNTALETCGYAPWSDMDRVTAHADVILFDIKHMDPESHFRLTGVDNTCIKDNALRLATAGRRLIVRLPLIPGCNDDDENLRRTAAFAAALPGVTRLDLLPYHRLGEPKYGRLGRDYALTGSPAASGDRVAAARGLIAGFGLDVTVGG